MTSSSPTDHRIDVQPHGEHVSVIEFERGPYNYFSHALITDLADTLERLAGDGVTRAVVLTGAGRHFCAGADLADAPDGNDTDTTFEDADGGHLYDAAVRLFRQPLPIVAALHGAVIGGGLGLALACDLRVGSNGVRLAAPFSRLGLHHGFGLSITLPLVVGHQHAIELLYTGRRLDSAEAADIGLLDRLTSGPPVDAAAALAAEIAAAAPIAVRSIRSTMRGHLADAVQRATAHERDEQLRHRSTADFAEGVRADAQRRRPNFTGA